MCLIDHLILKLYLAGIQTAVMAAIRVRGDCVTIG